MTIPTYVRKHLSPGLDDVLSDFFKDVLNSIACHAMYALTKKAIAIKGTRLAKTCSIFSGKDRSNNVAVITVLATEGSMTTWELTRRILAMPKPGVTQLRAPSSQEIRASNSIYYRRVRALESNGYVARWGTVISKGNEVPVYGLTFRGSLAASVLIDGNYADLESSPLSRNNVPEFVKCTSSINPFSELGNICLQKGVNRDLVYDLLIDPMRQSVLRGLANIEVAEDEHVMTTITPLLIARLGDLGKDHRYDLEQKLLAKQTLESDEAAQAIQRIQLHPTILSDGQCGILAGLYFGHIMQLADEDQGNQLQRHIRLLEARLQELEITRLVARLVGLE